MRNFVIVLGLLISQFAAAQGVIPSVIESRPDFLTLEKIHPYSGSSYLSHIDESGAMIRTVFSDVPLRNLEIYLLKNNSSRIFCDGDYELVDDYRASNSQDFYGPQYLKLTKINVCIDENGWIIAKPFKTELTQDQLQKIAKDLMLKGKKKEIGGGVFESNEEKEIVQPIPLINSSSKRTVSNINLE